MNLSDINILKMKHIWFFSRRKANVEKLKYLILVNALQY